MSCCLQEMRLPASASWPHVNRGMARRPAARPFRLAGPPPPPPAPCCCRSCPTPPRPLQLCSTPTAVRSPLCTAITFASSTRLLLPLPPRHATPAVVFNTDGREIPIVHRIIKVHERAEGSPPRLDILTKVRSVPAILPCVSRLSGTQPPHSCLGASGRKRGALQQHSVPRLCVVAFPEEWEGMQLSGADMEGTHAELAWC